MPVAFLALLAGYAAISSDWGGEGRSALVRRGESLEVVSAVCPGEHLSRVELATVDPASHARVVVWRAQGDVELPESLIVGVAPPGMTVVVAYSAPTADRDLELRLSTNRLEMLNSVYATQGKLANGRLVGSTAQFIDRGAFTDDAFRRMPCKDPYNRDVAHRVAAIAYSAALLAGIGVFLAMRYPRYKQPTP